MTRFALKGLAGRKLRTGLTAIAIVLGVAMISGTYVLTDSIDSAFNSIFTDVRKGSDAVITGNSPFDLSDGSGSTTPSFPESVLAKVRAVPEVATAQGGVNSDSTVLIDKNGKAITGNAPSIGFSIARGDSPFNPLRLVRGAWPGRNQIVIDESTAKKKDFAIGDRIRVQAEGPIQTFTISGIIRFGESLSTIGDATLAGFDLPTAQRLYGKVGQLDTISIASKPNVPSDELISALRAAIPPTTQVKTGQAQATEDATDTNDFITFLQGFLLAFAGIALFVGAFVIANSLSITIAQRTREFATLRMIGGSRRQVLTSVLLEALVVGVLASTIGLFLGLALAEGLFSLFDAVGFTLPNIGLVFQTRTAVVAIVVGVLVTVLASLRPAIRATRVPPIAAVREDAELPVSRFARFRTPGSVVLIALGFAALSYGLFGPGLSTSELLVWMGLGAVLIFFGVSLLSVRFVRPMAGALGWPAKQIGGISGSLARDNSRRNPQRTASTASALMIGLALVTTVAVLAAGITSAFRGAVDSLWGAGDYALTAQNNFSPIPIAVANAGAKAPGVEAVADVRTGDAFAFGHPFFATAVNPAAARFFTLDWTEGSRGVLSSLGANGAFVDDSYAKDHHLRVGSTFPLTFASGKSTKVEVRGIFNPPAGGSPFGRVTISAATWDRFNEQPRNLYSFVLMRGGQTDANRATLERALEAFPSAKVQTREQFIDNQISALNRILNILYVLLALSVIVSLFGIVNTLVLTVFERTREIGMLRAIGMSRRQLRQMIRYESVITALMGGVIGIVLGIILGALLGARVEFIDFTVPVTQIVVFTFAAIVVGLIAAIFPARRAARLNVLEALQYE